MPIWMWGRALSDPVADIESGMAVPLGSGRTNWLRPRVNAAASDVAIQHSNEP